jgi:endonuclease/exonuclease/phosphatase family metal-dependent hydrolase
VPAEAIAGPLRPELAPPRASRPSPSSSSTFRVVSFNVEFAPDVAAIARAIETVPALAGADVLLLQEIESHPGEPGSRAARLAGALGLGFAYAPARAVGGGTHGLAILSRFPLADVAVMRLPAPDLHVNRLARIALAATIDTSAGPVRLVNVHLDTRMNAPARILQLRPAVLDAGPRAIVAGDFNMNPYVWASNLVPVLPVGGDQAPIVDDYMRALGFAAPTARLGPTQRVGPLEFRLDAIYVRGLRGDEARVAREVDVSDHWPLALRATVGAD